MCAKHDALKLFEGLEPGTKIVLAPKFRDNETISALTGRIECNNDQLTNGDLTFEGLNGVQILVKRPHRANLIPVAAKFFVKHEGQSVTLAA